MKNDIRKTNAAVLAAAALLALPLGAAVYHADSVRGNDAADGLSPATAWKSLERVNAAELKPGDKMLFRRGSAWRGQLDSKSGEPGNPVFYGAYGEGAKPLFLGSSDRSRPEDWEPAGDGLWATKDPKAGGAVPADCMNPPVGFGGLDVGSVILDHGRRWGVKKWTKEDLKNELDYWYDPDADRVFIRIGDNPGRMFRSVELARKRTVIPHKNRHDVIWDSLAVMYSGSFAFAGGKAFRLTVRNCDMGWIGGSLQSWRTRKDGTKYPVRYGNGVEYWSPSWSNTVERCRIWEVYDAAVTPQQSRSRNPIHHITYRDNLIWNCEYSFEYWNHDKRSYTSDIIFEHNTCVNAGGGWGHGQRPNKNGAHVLSYHNVAPCTNIIVRNNVFCGTTDNATRVWNDWRRGAVFANNLYWIPSNNVYRTEGIGTPYQVRRTNRTDRIFGPGPREFARYQKKMGMDATSEYGKPVFIDADNLDFRLHPASPGRRLATDGGPVGARFIYEGDGKTAGVPEAFRSGCRHWALTLYADDLRFVAECDAAPCGPAVVRDGRIALPAGWKVSGKPGERIAVDCVTARLPVASGKLKGEIAFVIRDSGIEVSAPEGTVFTGSLGWGDARTDETIAVRADDPAAGSSVVSGPYVPEGADALFDVRTDRLLRVGGASLAFCRGSGLHVFRSGRRFSLSFERDFLSRRFNVKWRAPVEGGTFRTPPVGWMTWYSVKFDASEKVILENAEGFMKNFRGYTDERPVLWVDWEWGHGKFYNGGEEDEDVTRPRASVYPRGMAPLAADLSKMGFTPALWVSVVNDCRTNALWRARPEWVLGEDRRWCGSVWGDPTAPGFCEEYVPKLFSLYRSWGYKAFKWDTLPVAIGVFTKLRDRQHDPSLLPEEVYRRMIAAGRKAVGEKTFLMSCSGERDRCNLAAAEMFDAMRIGGDIFAWDSFISQGADRILRYQPLHGTLILSDGDNLVLRPEFSDTAQARTRVSVYGLAGLPVTLGDVISVLDADRISMLKRIMPVVPVKPASLARAMPVVGDGLFRSEAAFARPWGSWKVEAFSNLSTNTPAKAALSAPGCAAWDFWRDRLLSLDAERLELSVPPGDTTVVRVTPVEKDAVTLLSVSRHITQGGYEVVSFKSGADGASGEVKCPGKETVKVTLLLPEGKKVTSASHPYDAEGRVVRLRLAPVRKSTVEWKIECGTIADKE